MRDSETRFLYMSESERNEKYSDASQRSYYKRIVDGANQSFQDLVIMLSRLPSQYAEKINFETGLNLIHKSLAKKDLISREPYQAFENTTLGLEESLNIISKNYNSRLAHIAKRDFDAVKEWIDMAQKYPKPKGAPTSL